MGRVSLEDETSINGEHYRVAIEGSSRREHYRAKVC